MLKSDIRMFDQSLVKSLVVCFGMNKQDARNAVSRSALQVLLRKHPDMVLHYPMEGWTNDVWREYNHLPLEE